jgi:putative PIN family toxin of toxin-antitoxin system
VKVILDTNVLLGALISAHNPPDQIYQAWRAGRFRLITSTAQLDELRASSRYPKLQALVPAHRIGTMMNSLRTAIVLEDLPPVPGDILLNDPNDAFLIGMALAGHADYLITGDRKSGLLQQGHIRRTRIMTPAGFCAEIL